MSSPTAVSNQITDTVTQSNVKAIGEAPAVALGSTSQIMTHSIDILFENSVAAQQQQNALALAISNMDAMQIHSLDTSVTGGVTEKIGQLDAAGNLISLLTVLKALP